MLPAASVCSVVAARGDGRKRQIDRTAGVGTADFDVDLARRLIGRDPVEEERRAIGILGVGADAVGQRRRHGGMLAACFSRRHHEEAGLARHLLVEIARLPVAVEQEQTLPADEPAHRRRIVDGVDVGREVAVLDPLLEMLEQR